MEQERHKIDSKTKESEFLSLVEEFYSNTHWRQFHALLGSKPLPNSLDLLEKNFEISSDEVIDMVEGLTKLGIIKQEDNKFYALKPQFIIPEYMDSKENRIEGHKTQSFEILNALDKDKECAGDTTYITASEDNMKWFRSEYKKLVNELEKRAFNNSEKNLFSITYTDVKTSTKDWGEQ